MAATKFLIFVAHRERPEIEMAELQTAQLQTVLQTALTPLSLTLTHFFVRTVTHGYGVPACACSGRKLPALEFTVSLVSDAAKARKWKPHKCATFSIFLAAARKNVLPLFRKTKISISPILVLAIFRTMCHFPPPHASWHLSSNTDLGEGERKGQSGPRMSGPSPGR